MDSSVPANIRLTVVTCRVRRIRNRCGGYAFVVHCSDTHEHMSSVEHRVQLANEVLRIADTLVA